VRLIDSDSGDVGFEGVDQREINAGPVGERGADDEPEDDFEVLCAGSAVGAEQRDDVRREEHSRSIETACGVCGGDDDDDDGNYDAVDVVFECERRAAFFESFHENNVHWLPHVQELNFVRNL